MLMPRRGLAGAATEVSGWIAGLTVALLVATALYVGSLFGLDHIPEFKAAALFVAFGITNVIIATQITQRRLLKELRSNPGDDGVQKLAVDYAGACSRSIAIGTSVAGVCAYFMLTTEMRWEFLNTTLGVAIATGLIGSTATKWTMVCTPVFMVIGGKVVVPSVGDVDGQP